MVFKISFHLLFNFFINFPDSIRFIIISWLKIFKSSLWKKGEEFNVSLFYRNICFYPLFSRFFFIYCCHSNKANHQLQNKK